jgi:hypothetical protein
VAVGFIIQIPYNYTILSKIEKINALKNTHTHKSSFVPVGGEEHEACTPNKFYLL